MNDTHAATEIVLGRRALLVGATLAGSIATMGRAEASDPHPAWLAEWKAADARACDGKRDIEFDGADWKERERLGILIANTVAETPAGIQAQWEWLEADFGYLTDGMLGGEYEAFFRVLKAGMERMS